MDDYSKKHKKKHKKEKKKKQKNSSSESEDEWVEKKTDQDVEEKSGKRDEWMSLDMDFTSLTYKKENKSEKKDKDLKTNLSEKLGQSDRELNPYWRDGGDGLPPEYKNKSHSYDNSHSSQETKTSNKKYSEERSYNRSSSSKAEYSGYQKVDKSSIERKDSYERTENRDKSKISDNLKHDSNNEKRYSSSKSFKKPDYDDDFGKSRGSDKYLEDSKYRDSKRRWKKDVNKEEIKSDPAESAGRDNHHRSSSEIDSSSENTLIKPEPPRALTLDEMNFLSARMIKAEIRGNMKLAEELKLQLENARKINDKMKSNLEDDKGREIIVLTETDSKGFTRPLKSVRDELISKRKKIETHEGNKRVRYFADDDSQSLQEMFEKERFGSSREQNATFIKLMGKELSENNEDAFEETASINNPSRQDRKNWNDAIRDHVKKEKALDNCYWCLDSERMNQDVVVAVRNKVQLCVPSTQSLTEGHCIILPCDHISCATNLDEDVWEDIMNLRKNLVKVFEAEGDDVIFFECASNLDKFPHMQLHCVPIPKEAGDVAPIYFKKAIMECEMEWSNNKKVVDLKGKDVRKAIPKGLPYFAVDFGMQPGYAHVIEDKRLFPNNFAQEIIGGMLDIDHSKWRKLQRDSEENIEKKASYLKQLLKKSL